MVLNWNNAVEQTYFRIYVNPSGGNFDLSGLTSVADAYSSLSSSGYLRLGMVEAGFTIVSADTDGIENEDGDTLGQSKEFTSNFNVIGDTKENYDAVVALDKKIVTVVLVSDATGKTYVYENVIGSVNVSVAGNDYSRIPFGFIKKAATIGAVAKRADLAGSSSVTYGAIDTVTVTTAGTGYDTGDFLTVKPTVVGANDAVLEVTATAGAIDSVVVVIGGSGFFVGEVLNIIGNSGIGTDAVLTVAVLA